MLNLPCVPKRSAMSLQYDLSQCPRLLHPGNECLQHNLPVPCTIDLDARQDGDWVHDTVSDTTAQETITSWILLDLETLQTCGQPP